MSQRRKPDSQSLPTESDFVEHPEDLDQIFAWRHFGRLTLDEAKARFAEMPIAYQEDFMAMGTNAFAFYFPVIDWWLRSVPEDEDPYDDSEAWILAKGLECQFRPDAAKRLRPLIPAVLDLAAHVTANVRRFGDEDDQQRVHQAWTKLVDHVRSLESP